MNRDEILLERRAVAGERASRGDGMWRGASRIARTDLERTWPSYLVAALLTPLIGLISLSLLWLDLESYPGNVEGLPAALVADWVFLLALANLGINWTSLRWTFVHRDPFTTWLSFLKTLPVSTRELVLGRATVMLAATTVMALAFFLPTYALFPALRADIPPIQYLWFALLWVGYALFSGGVFLYLELGVRGRVALAVLLLWTAVLVSAGVLALALEVPLASGSLGLARAYGPTAAIPALVVGGGGLFLWCRAVERRLRKRELPS